MLFLDESEGTIRVPLAGEQEGKYIVLRKPSMRQLFDIDKLGDAADAALDAMTPEQKQALTVDTHPYAQAFLTIIDWIGEDDQGNKLEVPAPVEGQEEPVHALSPDELPSYGSNGSTIGTIRTYFSLPLGGEGVATLQKLLPRRP